VSDVTIYALIDPRDESVCYIGQTGNMSSRYASFVAVSNPDLHVWVDDLKEDGLLPRIHTLEIVSVADADTRERYYIQKFANDGEPLLNRRDNPFFVKEEPVSRCSVRSRLNVLIADINAERARQQQKKLTIRQLAGNAGLPPSVVSRLVNKSAEQVHFRTLDKLCKALHCTPGDILEFVPDVVEEVN
jgi:putative transcriptional regulator